MDIQEMIKALQKIVPAENFRKEPDYAIQAITALEAKYQLNTEDFISKNHTVDITEDDVFEWLNAFENLILFGGNQDMVNSLREK